MKKVTVFSLVLILLISLTACKKQVQTEKATVGKRMQQTAAEKQTADAEQEEYEGYEEEYDEEYEEEEYLSQDEQYKLFLDSLNFSAVDGGDGKRAPYRKIDYDAYPKKFDLREYGVVTPVKNQHPWGTCWAFGTIAACEISILSEMQTTYKKTPLDLSEHHLAWFSDMHLEDDSAQNGEGIWHDSEWTFLDGGLPYKATSLLASGTGVALEKDFPYHGKKGKNDGYSYSKDDDWTIDSKDRFIQNYELEESRILPSTAMSNWERDYLGFDEMAEYDIKDELLAGRGVSVSYSLGEEYYTEDTCAHYCGDHEYGSHTCCIVGWDDTFSRDNFNSHSKSGKKEKPEGDGAWIVKNSWGAETEDFPNEGNFGILDKNGQCTGYFYLSYYDKSIDNLVTFDFLVDDSDESYYIVDQYDYLQTDVPKSSYSEDMTIMANEFEAAEDEVLRCISLESGAPGVHIFYDVYKITDPGRGPDSAELWTSGEVDCRYAGFHRIDLDKPLKLKAGDRYLISFYQIANVDEKEVYLVSFHNETNGTDYYVKGIVNPGESWLYSEMLQQWIDWYDLVQLLYQTGELDEDTQIDNFSIKGFADPLH